MRLSIIPAVCLGLGALALSGGGAYLMLQPHQAEVVEALKSTDSMILAGPFNGDWRSVDSYIAVQRTDDQQAANNEEEQKRLVLQAELRRQLQPPMLPLTLVEDAPVKIVKPRKSVVAMPAAQSNNDYTKAVERNPVRAVENRPEESSPSLVSDHARETLDTLEAFKIALRDTGGAGKLPMAAPYKDQ